MKQTIFITDDPKAFVKDTFLGTTLEAVRTLASEQQYLTADDVWAVLPFEKPEEPRWMGNALQAAQGRGFIQPTMIFETSRQASNNRRPVRVWRSNIYGR